MQSRKGNLYTFVLCLLTFAFCLAASPLEASSAFHDEFHQTYTLAAQGRVMLENINGDVHITAWDRNEVQVNAIKRGYSQERLEDASIVVDAAPNIVAIRTCYPDHDATRHLAAVEYTVMVPRQAQLDEIKLINGALDIHGVAGDVRASSLNGAIKVDNLGGQTRLSTVNGLLQAAFEDLSPSKSISLDSISGAIELLLPLDARAEFKADTVSGRIENNFGMVMEPGHLAGHHVRAALRGGGTRIRVNNVNGDITIVPTWRGRRVRFT